MECALHADADGMLWRGVKLSLGRWSKWHACHAGCATGIAIRQERRTSKPDLEFADIDTIATGNLRERLAILHGARQVGLRLAGYRPTRPGLMWRA